MRRTRRHKVVRLSAAGASRARSDVLAGEEPYPLPRLELRTAPSLFEYTFEDVVVRDYRHHPAIKAPVAV